MSDPTFRSVERRRRFQVPESPDGSSSPVSGAPAGSPIPAVAPSPVADSAGGGAWREIDDYARSGTVVVVRSIDGEEAQAKLYKSRRYNPRKTIWEPYERWVVDRLSGAYLQFEPVQYRELA